MNGIESSRRKLIERNKKAGEKKRKEYYENPSICRNCKKTLSYEKRKNCFCNHSCSAKKNNLGVVKNASKKKCKGCGGKVDRDGCRYCSICDFKGLNKIRIPFDKLKTDAGRKIRVIEEEGVVCSVCKRKTWMGKPIPLVLDHIDGNHRNNKRKNFRLVCGNCDMQLPTYKNRNVGNGRKRRRKKSAPLA